MKECNKIFNIWIIIIGILLICLIWGGCSSKPKVHRVAILSGLDYFINSANGFMDKMTKLGYIEGKNIVYDLQRSNYDPPQERRILKKFVSDKVDLILTFPTEVSGSKGHS